MSYDVETQLEQSPETILALNKAAERKAAEAALKANQQRTRQELMARIQKNMKAHSAGEKARYCGWARISPYDEPVSDDFFYKGYDGIDFHIAIRTSPEEILHTPEIVKAP